jgi:glycosyltransferase involved in cell wall biosynthesis
VDSRPLDVEIIDVKSLYMAATRAANAAPACREAARGITAGKQTLNRRNGKPSVSVVVPVFNSQETIVATIESLLRQTYRAHEVIVIDDGSTDQTANRLSTLSDRIEYRRQANAGPAAARNAGIRLSSGDLVAFTDSDCLPDEDWLGSLVAGFTDAQVGGVGGIVRGGSETIVSEYVDMIRLLDPGFEDGRIPYLITANAAFRRNVLCDAGLFDERFRKPGGEEPDLCRRIRDLGYEFRLAEGALVRHHHRQSVRSLLRTIVNYGEGRFLLGSQWPEYRINQPVKRLLRLSVAGRGVIRRLPGYLKRYGVRRAFVFSTLDYLWQPAQLVGYLRGQRKQQQR